MFPNSEEHHHVNELLQAVIPLLLLPAKSYPFYFLNSLDSTPYFTLASLCQPHTPVIDSLLLIHSLHGCKDVSLPVLIGNSLFPHCSSDNLQSPPSS